MDLVKEDEIKCLYDLVDKMVESEKEEAQKMYQEVEYFLHNRDFSEYPDSQVRILLGLARYHVMAKEGDKVFELMDIAEKVCNENDLKNRLISVQSAKAIAHSLAGNHLKAIYVWEDMLEDMTKDHFLWDSIVNNLTVAYVNTKQFTRAVDLSYELLSHLDKEEDEEVRLTVLINLANSYSPINKHEKSLDCLSEAVGLARKQKNEPVLSYIYGNMSTTLGDLGRYEDGLVYGRKALELQERYYGDEHIADTLTVMGRMLFKLGRYEESEEYLKKALGLFIGSNKAYMSTANLHLGNLYLEQKRYDEAQKYIQKGYEISLKMDVDHVKYSAIKLLAALHEELGEYQEAVGYLRQLVDMQDDRYKEMSTKMISRQEAEYLSGKIEEKSESYRKKNVELESSNMLINKQAKALQKSNHDLHNSMAMLNRLITVISHDVRGPVANSAAALRMVRDQDLDVSVKDELISHVLDSLDSTSDLLTEIMIWIESRSYSSDIRRLMRDVSISPLIKSVVKLYQGQLAHKKITLNLELGEELPELHTEPNTLKIVLRNIISNALKYTPECGKIDISCEVVDSQLRLHIKDSGIGMGPEEIRDLKEHKIRSKEGTNQEFGMGMGLRLSLGYLKLLDASYEIHSQIDKGTEFVLCFKNQD